MTLPGGDSLHLLFPLGCVISPPQVVCEVQAQAVFPKIQVVNVCGGGSLSNLSKLHLWNLLSLDSFNHLLLSNLSPVELTCGLPNKHRLSACGALCFLIKCLVTLQNNTVNRQSNRIFLRYWLLPVFLLFIYSISASLTLCFNSSSVQHHWIQSPQLLS